MWQLIKSLLPIYRGVVAAGCVPLPRHAGGLNAAGLAGVAIAARNTFTRLFQRKEPSGRVAAHELRSMGARELNDLGIGVGEIDYLLKGGTQGARWSDASRSMAA